jgi:hypothetical protein
VTSTTNHREALRVLCELAGAEVCAWLGIPTPATGLVRFPRDEAELVEQVAGHEHENEVREVFALNRDRLAFCSAYLAEGIPATEATLKHRRAEDAAFRVAEALLAADAYMVHDDRRRENPNALWWEDRLVAIDHGSAFVGLDRPGETGGGLAAKTVLAPVMREHFLYAFLCARSDQVTFAAFMDALHQVDKRGIGNVLPDWPTELEAPQWNGARDLSSRMVNFLTTRSRLAEPLANEVRLLLGCPDAEH